MSDAPEPPLPLSPARKAARFARLLCRPAIARKLGTLVTEGYLAESGWVRSAAERRVVDAAGAPLPWATLPFVDFIAPRLDRGWTIFEYGAGASTLFYAARVRAVTAVEHNARFAAELRPTLPSNVQLLVQDEAGAGYCEAVKTGGARPVLVSVDGEDRNRCVTAAIAGMSDDGVLVLDDAERPEYRPAHERLTNAGFRAVEFWGVAPGMVTRKCTTVFYRQANVLRL